MEDTSPNQLELPARRSANVAENEMLKRTIGLVSYMYIVMILLCCINLEIVFLSQSPGISPTTLTAEVTRLKEKTRNLEVRCVTV